VCRLHERVTLVERSVCEEPVQLARTRGLERVALLRLALSRCRRHDGQHQHFSHHIVPGAKAMSSHRA
jgi:hypothetical protein